MQTLPYWANIMTNQIPTLPSSDVHELRVHLAAQCPQLSMDTWWLLGTSHCHLCEQAEALLQQLQRVTPVCYQLLDIVTLTDEIMTSFATSIPVILTPTSRLDYPFSVLDLQRLCE